MNDSIRGPGPRWMATCLAGHGSAITFYDTSGQPLTGSALVQNVRRWEADLRAQHATMRCRYELEIRELTDGKPAILPPRVCKACGLHPLVTNPAAPCTEVDGHHWAWAEPDEVIRPMPGARLLGRSS